MERNIKGERHLDTAIYDGDFCLNERGKIKSIFGIDEILQKIYIMLKVKKGSFAYDRNLGSELYNIKNINEHINDKAKALVQQTLCDMKEDISVKNVEVTKQEDKENLRLKITVIVMGQEKDVVMEI